MECYACANQATRQCRRCARVYCELHGGDLCAECLNPTSTLPSFNLYRGSLLALLVGTAVALWLLVRPPGSGGGREVVITQLTPTSIVTEVFETAERPTVRSATPLTTGTPPLAGTATATPPRVYVVQEGDTLIGIAEQFAPPGVDPFQYAQQIASASGLPSTDIATGQTLILP